VATDLLPETEAFTPRKRPVDRSLGRALRVGILIGACLIFIYPITAFFASIGQTQEQLYEPGLGIGNFSWDTLSFNWAQVMGFNDGLFAIWMRNSVILSVGGALVGVLTAIPSGYAMARLRFGLRKPLLYATLLTMMMPNTVLVIPIFLEVSAVGAINQFWAVIVILGFYPFGVYLSYIHFKTVLPYELVEAARIDGLTEVGIFNRIALPISKQAVALVGFFAFVAHWTNFYLPLVLLPKTSLAPISVGLQQMIVTSQLYTPSSAAGLNVELYMPELALAAIVSMLPVLVVFISAQRYLQRGATLGAVKA
jgi:multiple sugar transport system permease protein